MLALTIWGALHAAFAPRASAQAGTEKATETATVTPPPTPTPAPAAAAEAMSTEARAHYDRGLALYADKDYPGAIAELQAGYALDPRREFLFAEAQARRLSGDCKSAVPLYQKFLASDPDDVQVNATHIALGRCAAQMASAPPAPNPAPDQPRAAAPPALTTPARPAPSAPWYQDVAGGALLGAGVVGIATGAIAAQGMLSARDDARAAPMYQEYARHWDTARSRERIAIIAFAAGAALTGGAIIRYLRVRARPAPSKLEAWVAPGGRGGIAGVGGRF